eukprot:UN04277
MFGSYFKNNYEYILKKDDIISVIVDDMIDRWKENELEDFSENELEYVRLYVCKCCEICWIMLLQDVGVDNVLQFYPMEWKCTAAEKVKVVYTDEIHRKVLGSDRKCETVLYYVWPAISRGNDICGSNKIDVVVKDVFYRKVKVKEKKQVMNGVKVIENLNDVIDTESERNNDIKVEMDDADRTGIQ